VIVHLLSLAATLLLAPPGRTAGGVVAGGEGIRRLTAPLLQAGARAVVATGWRIGDRAAARLAGALSGGLARGLPATEALRAAKLDAIRRGAPPAEWAAFTVVGDPMVRVPLHTPPRARRWWWMVVDGRTARRRAARRVRPRTQKQQVVYRPRGGLR